MSAPALDGTPEGLAAAAAAREALKQKKRSLEAVAAPSAAPAAAKKPAGERLPPSCTHEVAVPPDFDVAAAQAALNPELHGTLEAPKWIGKLAKEYPFTLDPFQAGAIACIERRESVLVAAHTSAGKTVVAEYAIAKSLAAEQRVVYTSPLKALSNQKYRELAEEFGDVGLMTGDVTLNPNARCMVMTTEILRSMIYRGSEFLREVAWVVFDEVHYMQDRERGVVWEETIIFMPETFDSHKPSSLSVVQSNKRYILLQVWEETIIFMPKTTRMVFLSATLPNAFQFAQWVSYIHTQPCHVVYTDYRPTPLVHYGFPSGGKGLYLLVDERGNFREDNFDKMRAVFGTAGDSKGDRANGGAEGKGDRQGGSERDRDRRSSAGGGRGGRGGRDGDRRKSGGRGGGRGDGKDGGKGGGGSVSDDLQKLVGLIKDKHFEPAIVFSFSRRECEQYAGDLHRKAKVDFNTQEEKDAVTEVFSSAIECLKEDDRDLPFIKAMLPMLQCGIAVHHSGLLPILKELVEILFQEGLIKVLFSTETFAMGLNMPARTVVFTALRKWDGEENRWIGSGEYIQMSGRAGRRGKDDRGMVFLMCDDALDGETAKAMIQGKSTPLLSSFRLSYYTLLNLLRRIEGSGHNMEYVISKSFSQFQHEQQLPELESRLRAAEAEAAQITAATDAAAAEYSEGRQQLAAAAAVVREAVQQPQRCLHFLRPGRIVRVTEGERQWGYGVVVSVLRKSPQDRVGVPESASAAYLVDTLLCVAGSGGDHKKEQERKREAQGAPAPAALTASNAEMQVVPVPLPLVSDVSTLRVSIPADLRPAESRKAVLLTLRELSKRYPGGQLPLLDPVADMGIQDEQVEAAMAEAAAVRQRLADNPIWQAEQGSGDPSQLEALRKKSELIQEAEALKKRMKESQLVSFKQESRHRSAVLRKLGHIDADGAVTLKGQAACEIDTADELLTTEMMFDGTFGGLDKHALVALVSCLVPVDRSNDQIKLTAQLAGPLGQLQAAAQRIAEVSKECKLEVDAEEYVKSFRPFLMDVIYAWSKGASFGQVCGMTEIMEGSIIRAARRLDELMQQLERAAAVVGDKELADKFAASRETIRRGIMFSASLYL
ncbi:superkiller viralicidic activity 2-like 2 isoform A [Chlorella sorokiniana]|uniref:Superkiller viralicidic activity 2-like 2 isoform A n=1 Tax=Chlorella sorokiniana TaxID=3076 RepID=A0A2P6U451_CHLSO|nr:superkiller viralicidic activity 2-like 2 isoform B [Chlorella sorokiniana]PRW61095.1 superkiller viralicidic activity 2-like 2 isoform A [Chlorella sorokiniana]|eukprot:PRW61094.1 superkiller viralicidic activity 2-like 2 isoform B [Chlorella sorokiniana]